MDIIEVDVEGDPDKTKKALERMTSKNLFTDFDRYGQMGVRALSSATPVDTGLAARSWYHRVIKDDINPGIEWSNSDVEGGLPVVILIQYGHGTGTGGYVQGRDFINPAMRPLFDRIAADVWEKVRNA